MNTNMIHVTGHHTEAKSNNDFNEINSIFHDPKDEQDNNWIWRESLESARRDPRNSIYYANYIGSKGTRKYVEQLSSHNPIDKKPAHYLKHLVKIGCPKHDLYPIFQNHLHFNVNPAICTHKSWKCQSPQTNSNEHNFGKLLYTLSFTEIGLEWKRGAYSVNPLQIKYNNTFSTNLYIKRIANTNFNKIFRPGSYGNAPSLKKGSWKDGKVFYVFKNDKLCLSVDNDHINIVFELESPSTIIQDDTNKHAVIDGWKNVVGGVGFYCPPKSKSNAIHTVLVLRKSMEFPMECLQKSKIKVYCKNDQFFRNIHNHNKLIIGSREFNININENNDDLFSLSNSHSPSPLMDNNTQFMTPLSSSCGASTISMTNPLPMIPGDNESLFQHGGTSNFDLSIPPHPQSPQFATFDASLSVMDNDTSSYNFGSYGGFHGGSGSVISQRYNPMNCTSPTSLSFDTLSADPFNNNHNKSNRFCFDVHEMGNKLQTKNMSSMRNKFEYTNNGYLLRQNQLLRNKVNELETMNKEFLGINGKLQQERDQLLNTIQCLQSTLNKQRNEINEMKQMQYPMNTPWYS